MALSHVEPEERAIIGLRRMGVIDPTEAGDAEGINWYRGPEGDQAHLFWRSWAESMWIGWGHAGLARAAGVGKPGSALKSLEVAPQ